MTKPVITTRSGKGSALTWTEGDTNLTNLRDATITLTAGSGGTSVVSDLNGAVTLVAGTNVTLSGDNTAKTITINSTASGGATSLDGLSDVITTSAATGDLLRFDGTNWVDTAESSITVGTASVASAVTLTADNTTNASNYLLFVNAATGNLSPRTDTGFTYNPSTGVLTATSFSGAHNGTVGATTASTGAFTSLSATSYSQNAGAFTLALTGNCNISTTGQTTISSTTIGTINNMSIGASTASTGAFTTLSASSTVSGTGFSTYLGAPPAIGGTTAAAGTFTTLTSTRLVIKDLTETVGTVTYAATITPDVANGTIQKITLTGNVTFSAFANPVAGQSLTLIITQDATGSRTLTSTMKFSGGSKTLTTTANAIDILTVFYDGSTYYASLGKGFA